FHSCCVNGTVAPCLYMAAPRLLSLSPCSPPGQGGQQVVTQIIRGQPVSTGISAASPVTTVTGQGVASPNAAGQAAVQTPPCTPRAQGQSQVKLTMAQLTQLTQVCEGDTPGVLCYLVF
ncbi:hypothetical protein XENOCAPTIV_026858, partial [Xenoophorus captivus]